MEKLQAAIEKARAQRAARAAQEAQDGPASAQTAPAQQDAPVAAPAGENTLDTAWGALKEIKLNARRLTKKRVMTLQGGAGSAPFDLLRTRMLQQARQNGWRRIGLVSPHSGCGKSTTIANLAFSLARQSDTRTIAFDFDLRRHGLTNLLEQRTDTSLLHMLEGRLGFAEHGLRHGTNVAFALNRNSTAHASEVLMAAKTHEVLSQIEETYAPDLMLFDLPPLMASDDNFGFLNKIDAALILTVAEKTSMSQIDVAERQVAELTNVMGIVLNQCRYMDGAYGHEYNYY